MEAYAQALNFAIPGFVLLIAIEFIAGKLMGQNTIRSMDTISSLSSGQTNILKDVLGLTVILLSYRWMYEHWALTSIETTWYCYVLAFVGLDFAGYWQHRLSHKVNVLWNEHIIHHSSEEYNLSCALRQTISKVISIYTILMLPMALLGIPPEVVGIIAPIHLFAQFWYHTRLIGKMGILEKFIVTPSHHRVHHAINPEYIDKNFSQIFIIWDHLFGTFQEEMKEIPPVYGVKVPVKTWNPFLINFKHLWQLIVDAYHAESWWDKARIWFMPTGWRPADVQEKYPIEIIEDVYQQEKYDTPASFWLQAWAWTQLILNLSLMLYLFNSISSLTYPQMLVYCGFLFLSIFSYTTLMDRSRHAWWVELLKTAAGFGLMFKLGGWFGIDEIIPGGSFIVGGYLVVSAILAAGFTFWESPVDKGLVRELENI